MQEPQQSQKTLIRFYKSRFLTLKLDTNIQILRPQNESLNPLQTPLNITQYILIHHIAFYDNKPIVLFQSKRNALQNQNTSNLAENTFRTVLYS